MPNFIKIAPTAAEIGLCECQYYASLTWTCLFTPILGFLGTFPPIDVTHRRNPKKDHPWAEPRHLNHRARTSIARFELGVGTTKKGQDKTRQDRKKVTKGLYFTYLWRSPHWSDVYENLFSRWCSRRNHVCQVSKWNFQGLRFYRGSNFPFSYWFLNGPYNSAALLRCLWLQIMLSIRDTEMEYLY